MVTTYRPEWVNQELVDQLRAKYCVELRSVWRESHSIERRSESGVAVTKLELIVAELIFFLRCLMSPGSYRPQLRFVCFGGHYATMLFGRVLRSLGRHPRIYILNFYLHGLGRSRFVRAILGFLLTSDVCVFAQATSDADYLAEFLPPGNIIRLPYAQGDSRYWLANTATRGEYVFAGGWSNRDYDLLFQCASNLPTVPFVVVASERSQLAESVPPNVTLRLDQTQKEFERLLAASRFVVVPLRDEVGSSGQMVVLSSMEFGKAVVVPQIGAVTDYVEEGVTGLFYERGSEASLRDRILELYDDEALSSALGVRARAEFVTRLKLGEVAKRVVDLVTA